MADTLTTARLADRLLAYRHLLPPVSPALVARMNEGGGAAAAWKTDTKTAPATPVWPAPDRVAARDRAMGCVLGLAVGGAVGAMSDGKARGSFAPLTDLAGGSKAKGGAVEWTGDTTMAMCLGQSLQASGTVDLDDFMLRLQAWLERGENTVNGSCSDIGAVTRAAIERYAAGGEAAAGDPDAAAAGNGSLVRLAPLAVFSAGDADIAEILAARQSRATHATLESVDACRLFAVQLVDALSGADKDATLRQRVMALCPQVLFISAGEYKEKPIGQVGSTAYVVETLEAALWSVWRTDSFRAAVLAAANLGGAAASVAAVAGQLAGALYGASSIPEAWLGRLPQRDRIELLAHDLFEAGDEPEPDDSSSSSTP